MVDFEVGLGSLSICRTHPLFNFVSHVLYTHICSLHIDKHQACVGVLWQTSAEEAEV